MPVFSDPGARMNDGGTDRQGRFFCGSMDYDMARPRAALYRLDPDLRVRTVLDGITVSNGIGWSLDGEQMYYIDSVTRQVDVFDYDTGSGIPSQRRRHALVQVEGGIPDGMALDVEGGVWVAVYGGHAVHRYDSGGTLDAIIDLPVSNVTACAFGGPELNDLCITTSRLDLPRGAEPAAGALFYAQPGATGLPTALFAG